MVTEAKELSDYFQQLQKLQHTDSSAMGAILHELEKQGFSLSQLAALVREVRQGTVRGPGLAEHVPMLVTGCWRDVVTYPDGTQEAGSFQLNENLVVNQFARLLCGLLITTPVPRSPAFAGITHMALGTGYAAWDTGPATIDGLPGGTAVPNVNETQLVTEMTVPGGRKPLDTAADIDTAGNVVTTGPTGRLLLGATFLPGEAIGTIREFGLFGGLAATGHTLADTNQGYMVDHIVHAAINKTSGYQFQRQVQLIFF